MRRRRILAIAAVLVTVGVALAAGLWVTQPPRPDPAWQSADAGEVLPETAGQAVRADTTIPNYRFSIVPGGVHSVLEMRQAIERDPVVATHYAGLDPGKFRVEALPARVEAHVSYRKGDEVFWTRKKLVLKAGEKVLTDGTNVICARCGNRVSMEALKPELPEEPAAEEFEQLDDPVRVTALPSSDPSDPGTILDPRVSSSGAFGPGGVFGGSSAGTPGMEAGTNATSDPESGAGSGSAGGSNQSSNPGAGPGVLPGPGTGGNSGPGHNLNNAGPGPSAPVAIPEAKPNLGPWPGSGPNPLGPGSGPGSGPNPLGPWPGSGPGAGPNEGPGANPVTNPVLNPNGGPLPGSGSGPTPLGPGSGPTPGQGPIPTPEPTPEPTTLVLTGLGAAGLYLAHLRRRSRHRQP